MTSKLIEETLRQHLEMRLLAGGDMPLARLLLTVGKIYEGTAYRGRRMQPKRCFENALKHAEAKGLLYAEGFGLSGRLMERGLVLPVEHAWCVDGAGQAIDPTWEDPGTSVYLGMEFEPTEVWKRVADTGTYGIFGSGPAGCPDIGFLEALMPSLMSGTESRKPV